jgi:hypothetical protein
MLPRLVSSTYPLVTAVVDTPTLPANVLSDPPLLMLPPMPAPPATSSAPFELVVLALLEFTVMFCANSPYVLLTTALLVYVPWNVTDCLNTVFTLTSNGAAGVVLPMPMLPVLGTMTMLPLLSTVPVPVSITWLAG